MSEREDPGRRRPDLALRQPRIAEMVAGLLRRQILDGTLADGDELPRQEQLLADFGVSKPSLREALRILETEGLLTVRRGNVGGAVVHVPVPGSAAYMLGLVLQAESTDLLDLGDALRMIEPLCASLCAGRADRLEAVVPQLREIHASGEAVLDDERAMLDVGRRFHESLVQLCGNRTVIVVVGALESLWSAHERAWASSVHAEALPDAEGRRAGQRAHQRIIELIEAGDIDGVARAVRRHVEGAQEYARGSWVGDVAVDASTLRQPSRYLSGESWRHS